MRAVVWVVVTVVLLLAGAGVADVVLRERTEREVSEWITDALPATEGADVTIHGFPFLLQVAAGRIDRAEVSAARTVVDDLRLVDVEVELTGVTTTEPHTAATIELTALATTDAIEDVLPVPLDLVVRGGELRAVLDLAGLPLHVALVARGEGREVVVDVVGFVLAGLRVDESDLPPDTLAGLQGLGFAVPGLPAGLEIADLTVDDAGLVITASGRDVRLDAG